MEGLVQVCEVVMTDAQRIKELERLLAVAQYDRAFLQRRLDAIRRARDTLTHLIEHPLLSERLDAMKPGDNVMDVIMGKNGD